MDGLGLIRAERQRQIEKGYTPEYDQRWEKWELRRAAENYLRISALRPRGPDRKWPWTRAQWKPSPEDRVRELAIAGALFLAEAERREFRGLNARLLRAKTRNIATRIDRLLRRRLGSQSREDQGGIPPPPPT